MPKLRTFARLAAACLAAALAAIALPALAGQDEHQHHGHHHAEATPGYARQVAYYRLPATPMLRADGTKTLFPQEIDDGRPVVLNFIYTSCTAICPVLSHSFAEFQNRLGAERDKVHMVSISIDPEEDTPKRLTEYAKHFEAGSQWGFYTGSAAASASLQKAFQSYFGDKMHHRPMTFMRASPREPWVRLEGFTSPDDLLAEYQRLMSRH